jgi:hypothetical protein
MSRLSRFLHLEKERRDAPAPAGAATRERFGAAPPPVSEPAPPPPDPVAAVAEPAPAPPVMTSTPSRPLGPALETLALAENDGAYVTIRCANCEADNGPYNRRCVNCNTPLDTPVQQVFNERWARQRAEEKAREDEEIARLAAERARADEEQRRLLREADAIMAGARAGRRWTQEEPDRVGRPSLGLVLLRQIPDARIRLAVLAVVVGVTLALVFIPQRGSETQMVGIMLTLLVSLMFLPPGWFGRGGRWE